MDFSGFEVIDPNQNPTTLRWVLVPLYKLDQRGATRYWQIGFEPTTNKLISRNGTVYKADGTPGAIKTSNLSVKLNKTGRNYQAQALLQARSKFKLKYKGNYRRQNEEIPTRPMAQLAKKYIIPDLNTNIKSNITQDNLLRGVICQPKVDGIRALAWKEEKSVILLSRLNNEFVSPVHIREELWYFSFYLTDMIKKYLPYYDFTKEYGVDGELYNHDIIFETITSIVRSDVVTHEMKYYIFDIIILEVPVETRVTILVETYNLFIQSQYYKGNILVIASTLVHSYQDIKNLHDSFVSQGYEGLMIRKMAGTSCLAVHIAPRCSIPSMSELRNSYYKPGRNNNLLKYKLFQDDEGTVIDIISGEGKEEGLALMVIRDKYGKVFKARPRGSYESRRIIYDNKDKYIGLPYTYRYQELSAYGIPRIPVGITFRTYE